MVFSKATLYYVMFVTFSGSGQFLGGTRSLQVYLTYKASESCCLAVCQLFLWPCIDNLNTSFHWAAMECCLHGEYVYRPTAFYLQTRIFVWPASSKIWPVGCNRGLTSYCITMVHCFNLGHIDQYAWSMIWPSPFYQLFISNLDVYL